MKLQKFFFYAFACFLINFEASAFEISNGKDLLQACTKFKHLINNGTNDNVQKFDASDLLEIGQCMGFIASLSNTHTFVTLLENKEDIYAKGKKPRDYMLFCMPDNLNHNTEITLLIDGLQKRAKQDENELSRPATLLALEIYSQSFPCKSKS